jgi:hypothetical protein
MQGISSVFAILVKPRPANLKSQGLQVRAKILKALSPSIILYKLRLIRSKLQQLLLLPPRRPILQVSICARIAFLKTIWIQAIHKRDPKMLDRPTNITSVVKQMRQIRSMECSQDRRPTHIRREVRPRRHRCGEVLQEEARREGEFPVPEDCGEAFVFWIGFVGGADAAGAGWVGRVGGDEALDDIAGSVLEEDGVEVGY